MSIETKLDAQCGPLMTITALAKLLDRSPESLRVSLRTSSDWTNQINAARIKIGRRVYFRTAGIAAYIENKTAVASK